MKKLTLEEYKGLPAYARRELCRAAFGGPGDPYIVHEYDLAHLRALLEEENARTGVFPRRWTDSYAPEDETPADPPDLVSILCGVAPCE